LCRRHHRLKTHHGGWGYTVLEPGSYLWSSPHGYQFLRDHTGTTDVTRDRATHPPDRERPPPPPRASPSARVHGPAARDNGVVTVRASSSKGAHARSGAGRMPG